MKGIFFLLCKARGNLVLSTTRFSKHATDIFYLSKNLLSNGNMSENTIRGLDACAGGNTLIASLTETCLSKSNGIFSAVSSGKFGALQGESRFLLGYLVGYKMLEGERKGDSSRRFIWGKSSAFAGK